MKRSAFGYSTAVLAAAVLAAVLLAGFLGDTAFAQKTKKSTLTGAGLGALAGQVIGKDTESTLIGGAVGAGVGYVIGNEKDKKEAERINAERQATASEAPQPAATEPAATEQAVAEPAPSEAQGLVDSVWKVESITPNENLPEYVSKIVVFRPDDYMQTITTFPDGGVALSEETYRVVNDTLVINKPGYLINARFSVKDDQLVISAENFSAVLTRMKPEGE